MDDGFKSRVDRRNLFQCHFYLEFLSVRKKAIGSSPNQWFLQHCWLCYRGYNYFCLEIESEIRIPKLRDEYRNSKFRIKLPFGFRTSDFPACRTGREFQVSATLFNL